ncbi:mis18-binding protein 1 isoform X2 [Eleginops maclovinus]|uniref:mis18-binding protein 1 isoform X2 n=1 Tax=Eleginops maclovinus TaxID=56733 RepID=UPI0030800499
MESYQHICKKAHMQFESPAKVFAKLKSKVSKDNPSANQGSFTGKDPPYGGVFKPPRTRSESTWMTDQFKEYTSVAYREEAQALTLSPISSPKKTFCYSDISSERVEEVPPGLGHGCTPRRRAFFESTALVNRPPSHTEPAQIRDSAGFNGFSRTPVKSHPVENDFVSYSPNDKRMPPPLMLSPTRNSLRKRKWETQEFDKIGQSRPERKTSRAFSADSSTCVEDVDNVRGFYADPIGMDQFTHEPVVSNPQSSAMTRCIVSLKRCHQTSPAKMFNSMKKRASKTEQQEVNKVCSTNRNLFCQANFPQSTDRRPFKALNMGEMEDTVFRDDPENLVAVNLSSEATEDSQSDTQSATHPSENIPAPELSAHPVLHEDPLVLNSPRISIPKKEAVFRRNNWMQHTKFPCESVIHLKKWYLRRSLNRLFLGGTHRDDNVPWNTNVIVERVSNNVVKTTSGSIYILLGRMNMNIDTGFPNWLLNKFAHGFPPDWDVLYEKLLSESKDVPSRGKDRKSERSRVFSQTNPDASTVKRHRQKSLNTPDSRPPPLSDVKVSRSGRVLRTPLEYWKGGRVILDANMNVTIHDCYETTICFPNVTTTVSTSKSPKPARAANSEGHKQCEPANIKEASVPLRRVKAPPCRHTRAKVELNENPSYSLVDRLTHPEKCSGTPTMSRRKRKAAERNIFMETSPQNQPEKSSTRRSKKQAPDTIRPSVEVFGSERAVQGAPESSGAESASSQDKVEGRKKTEKVQRKSSRKASKVLPTSVSSISSSEDLGRITRGTCTKQKRSKCPKSLSPPKPLLKLKKPSKKKPTAKEGKAPHLPEQDEEQWTEAELMRLQEAVSYFPKYMAGYWAKVAKMVRTRSAEECHYQHTSQATSQTPEKTAKKQKGGKKKKKEEEEVKATKDPNPPVISARAGTFKRKQQVRQFLEAMPREDVEDAFSSDYMQRKRFEVPSMCQSEEDFNLSEMEPLSPTSTVFPEVKTPQCVNITPGMMGSLDRTNNEKYVHQLQKRMKKNQFNVCKQAASSKTFTPTPSVKRTMRRCGNTDTDNFVVWEMFPGKDAVLPDSGEEEDFYFSHDF